MSNLAAKKGQHCLGFIFLCMSWYLYFHVCVKWIVSTDRQTSPDRPATVVNNMEAQKLYWLISRSEGCFL